METILNFIDDELNNIINNGRKPKTGDVRKVSAKVYRKIKDQPFENKLELCETLLDERRWATGIIAYDIAFREREHYTPQLFDRFESWLFNYVRDWGDCDDFCTHAFGVLLARYNHLFGRVVEWCNHPDFWVRRAAAVILIYPISKGMGDKFNPFTISDLLMNDNHYLVLKGYGWLLKVYGIENPDRLERYLADNVHKIPRVSFRYAVEKLDKERRERLMKL